MAERAPVCPRWRRRGGVTEAARPAEPSASEAGSEEGSEEGRGVAACGRSCLFYLSTFALGVYILVHSASCSKNFILKSTTRIWRTV